jgi:drug/metabolite transporter (DMT)-like permease
MLSEAIVIGSEVALSLYPILIKTVPATLNTQLLSRFLTFTVLAALLAKPSALVQAWGTGSGILRSSGLGMITLAHVAASYYAFKELPAGVAMSLFYTYPLLNLVGGVLFFGESISLFQSAMMIVCFLGVLLVSFGSAEGLTKSEGGEAKEIHWKGVASALAAALTEVAMYFAVRTAKVSDPFFATLELYPGALLGMLGLLFFTGSTGTLTMTSSVWLPMTLFNALIGFVGYTMRFYAIPKVSTLVFSLLSFIGVVSSFGFGWLFASETPSLMSALGAGLITVASAATVKF